MKKINVLLMLLILIMAACENKNIDPIAETERAEVASTDPLNDAVDVEKSREIKITFTEEMDESTINASSFTVKQGNTEVAGTVAYTSKVATFTPAVDLGANLVYNALISTEAKGMDGQNLASATEWSFTTKKDATEPTRAEVASTDPLNDAIDVEKSREIKITFTEEMDESTINASSFTVKQGNTEVAGTVAYASKVATFTPSVELNANLVYKAMISTEAKGVNGLNLASATEWAFTTEKDATVPLMAVDLGTAGNYVILAKTAINNNPTSSITGDMGISPAATSYITGFSLTDATGYATSAQVTGKVFGADMADPTPINLTTAVENMITAYNDAAGRPSPDFTELGTGNIGGQTLSAGLYKWTNTVSIPTDLTISGGPDDVWIFQIAGDLTVSSAVNITLSGGAQAKNIFWQVAGEATIGTNASFEGVILSMTGVTLGTGASYNGRILAQTAVILDGNAVTKP